MRRFELVEGKSSKFWEISLSGDSFTVTFGRIGTNGQVQSKSFGSAEKASAEHDKLVKEKTKKGYVEVNGKATAAEAAEAEGDPAVEAAAPAAKVEAAAPAAKVEPPPTKPAPKAAPKPEPKAAPASAADGFLDAGQGYSLGIVDGAIVARNDKGKVLGSIPKKLEDGEVLEMLEGALELLATHAAECREAIEGWMLRSLPVPRVVLEAVWVDPDWQAPLSNLVIAGSSTGILRAVQPGRGLGVVDLDGETRWLTDETVLLPHPILLEDLDDWRSILTELGVSQGTAQLFRETFVRPSGDEARKTSLEAFSGGSFAMLTQANNEARKLGYRVSGGCAVCRVWEGGRQTEARYYLGDGDPMYETSTGDLSWVDGKQQLLRIEQVGPVAFSEGMRMASAIYAKRKIEQAGDEDV